MYIYLFIYNLLLITSFKFGTNATFIAFLYMGDFRIAYLLKLIVVFAKDLNTLLGNH